MKIIATFNCDSWLMDSFAGYKLMNSWKYFHPEIPIIWYNENDTNRIMKENPGFDRVSYMPIIMKEIKKKYDAEFILHLDADSLVLSRLEEILKMDYEIAGVRNNSDFHTGDERHNRPHPIKNLPNEKYVNCGCICTNSNDFLDDWYNLNLEVVKRFGGVKEFLWCEQNMYNISFHSGKYNAKILDEKGGNLFYGTSANMYSDIAPDFDYITKEWNTKNPWGSWYEIEEIDRKCFLRGKEIKLLHAAHGGSAKSARKIGFELFNPKFREYAKKITGLNE